MNVYLSQLEKKSKVSLNSLRKADKDYTEASQKAEQVRQDWEVSVAKVGYLWAEDLLLSVVSYEKLSGKLHLEVGF